MKYYYEYKIKNGAKVGGHNLEKIIIKDDVIILEGVDVLMDCDGEYERDCIHLEFNFDTKTFNKTYGDDNTVHEITVEELQAINQQCKELGWLDE